MPATTVRISWNRSPWVVPGSIKLFSIQPLKWSATSQPNDIPTCQIELWPTYVCSVPAAGIAISRDLLTTHLPAWVITTERVRSGLSVMSSLEQISNATVGHCSIRWRGKWYLFAHSMVTIGSTTYQHDVKIPLDRTTKFLIGLAEWPVTVHLGAVALPL